jgi:hypothetical protein
MTGGLTAAVPVEPGDTVEDVFGANRGLLLRRWAAPDVRCSVAVPVPRQRVAGP